MDPVLFSFLALLTSVASAIAAVSTSVSNYRTKRNTQAAQALNALIDAQAVSARHTIGNAQGFERGCLPRMSTTTSLTQPSS